jgi:hypothetical protein
MSVLDIMTFNWGGRKLKGLFMLLEVFFAIAAEKLLSDVPQ